ncbi:protein HGV2 isoform X2 [Coccinella septempunctata]|nr:protein HGV2 isoform X2 [Coccinella septempunctata]
MADVNIDPDSKDSKQLFNQGVKAFVLRDYKNAVDALGRATELMVSELGDDLHDSLGDTYLYYGKALLSLYRQESDPIGNLPKQLETSASEEQEPEEDEEAENEENESKDGKEESEQKDDPEGNKNGEDKENGDDTKENTDEKEDEEEDVEDEEDCLKMDEADKSGAANANESFLELDPAEPEADEDPTDLQVAWEVLELAKKIFHKRGDDGKKAYAETLTTLGEISLESENYIAAINDFKEAADVQTEVYPDDSRKVAETYYNLGVAFASNTAYKEGITNLKKSIEYLERRIRNLEQSKENPEEVQEMKDLIPEIYEKIRDLKSLTDETIKKLDELTKQPELASKILDGASSSSSKQASDISHLVKRKRKAEDNDEECNPPKKCPE